MQLVVVGATPAVAAIVAQTSTLMVYVVFALSASATASIDTPAVGAAGLWLWLSVSHWWQLLPLFDCFHGLVCHWQCH